MQEYLPVLFDAIRNFYGVLIYFLDKKFIFSYLDVNLCRKRSFGISYTTLTKGGGNMSNGYGSSFALIVVLFILLIIVGAAFFRY